jgi:hypothetical protein
VSTVQYPTYFSAGECQCGACGRLFSSVSAFDKHRPGVCDVDVTNRRKEHLLKRVIRTNPRGVGGTRVVWCGAGERPAA